MLTNKFKKKTTCFYYSAKLFKQFQPLRLNKVWFKLVIREEKILESIVSIDSIWVVYFKRFLQIYTINHPRFNRLISNNNRVQKKNNG